MCLQQKHEVLFCEIDFKNITVKSETVLQVEKLFQWISISYVRYISLVMFPLDFSIKYIIYLAIKN